MSPKTKIRIMMVSNGFGEDQIACKLLTSLKKTNPNLEFYALPLVGNGLEYKQIGVKPLIKNKRLPSEGFLRKIGDIIKDIAAGVIQNVIKQRVLVKKMQNKIDATICVGDVFCLCIGSISSKHPTIFLPTAKSDTFMSHSFLEKFLIKKLAIHSYPRDKETTHSFQKSNMSAGYFGNPMMDKLEPTNLSFPFKTKKPIVAILPGSKNEAYKNLAFILTCLTKNKIINEDIHILVAKAKSLSMLHIKRLLKKLNAEIIDPHSSEIMPIHWAETGPETIISESFIDVVHHADVVIGLSGTANEQAIQMGKHVICFPGFGPQSTLTRFKEQRKMMGDQLHIIPNQNPDNIIDKVKDHIFNPLKKAKSTTQQDAATRLAKDIIEKLQIKRVLK